jgi:2-aminobenzoate-CoA ligase
LLDPSSYIDTFARDRLPPRELWPDITFSTDTPKQVNAAVELLDSAVERGFGDRPCLHTLERTWSYRELLDMSNRIASVLTTDFRLVPGNRVLLRSANNPMLAACWFGVLKAGGIAVTTMPLLRARELAQIVDKAAVRFALCDEPLGEALRQAREQCSSLERVGYFHSTRAERLEAQIERQDGSFQNFLPSRDDVALIAFTSGTTGPPKATMHFHRDVLAICDIVPEAILKSTPDDIFAGSPPFGFTYGLGSLLLFPIRRGASSVLLERCTAETLLQAVERFRVTTLMTGPTLYRAMIPQLSRFAHGSLRMCCSSGEHLPATVFNAWRERTGLELVNVLGSTEMLHAFAATTEGDRRPGSVGIALPGYEATVLDDEMNPAKPDAVGRLAVRGRTGCRYLDDPERQSVYVSQGWNLTGDAFRRDADGRLWHHSRADDMIVSSGYNISGAEIEEVLSEQASVRECAVVGVPDEARGRIVKAFVVLHDPAAASPALAAELQQFVKTAIAPYKYPRAIEFVAELPRTSTGKIQRAQLREQGR